MSLRDFLNHIQKRVLQLRSSVQKSQQGRLRVMSLEDRRLLDATAGFLGGQLLLDGFQAADSLAIHQDTSGHVDFDLTGSSWSAVSDPGLSLLNAGQTLRLDAASVGGLNSLDINAGDASLSGIQANAELHLNSLQIRNGGLVQLSDLNVTADAAIDADTIIDVAGSDIMISGAAFFEADSIALGDNDADVTNFGAITFASTGDVSISEDSAMEFFGASSANSLTLVSLSSITNTSGSSLNVAGTAVFNADSIELNADGSTVNFGSVNFTAANGVVIEESSDLLLSGNSRGGTVAISAAGNIESAGAGKVAADSLFLAAEETLLSSGSIGSASQDLLFDSGSITTTSDGDQHLASSGATTFTSLKAVDSSSLFDGDTSATISLDSGEFTGSHNGVSGSLFVADGVSLIGGGVTPDLELSATSDITFRIASADGPDGGTPGVFDQWLATDSVHLGGSALTVADENLLVDGTTIRVIDNDGSAVVDTFSGLAEGAVLSGTSGQRYQISYVGGDGNDVTLTALTSTFSFGSTADSVAEDVSSGEKLVIVNRSGDTSAADSVAIAIAGASATQGTDFGSATQVTAMFAAGETSATVSIAIADDNVVEADESLTMEILAPNDSLVDASANTATLSIINDDVTTVQFQLASETRPEGDSGVTTATYQVTSSHAVYGGFTIGVSSHDLQASSGTDYNLLTSNLNFSGTANETQTVTVGIHGETLFESDEAFQILLGSISTGNVEIDHGAAFSVGDELQVSLTNDDTKSLVLLDSGNLTISDETLDGEANEWTLQFDSLTNEVVVSSSTTNLGTGTAVAVNELRFDAAMITGDIIVDAGGGDDVLIVNYQNGNPIVGTGLIFTGGGQEVGSIGDGLSLIGDGFLNATYAPDEDTFGAGQIQVGGTSIQFEGLEPIDISGFATATLTLPGGPDVLTIADGTDFFGGGTNSALRVSGTSDGVAIETAAFWGNNELVIDTVSSGADGVDLITVTSATGTHSNTNVHITTGATAGDEVRINGNVEFDGDFSINSDVIAANTATISAGGEQTFTGGILVESNTTFSSNSVSIIGTLNSAAGETNSVNIAGDAVFEGPIGSTDALAALTVSGTAQLGGDVSTSADQNYNGAVTLSNHAVLTSTASGSVIFTDAVDGPFALTVNTSGTTRFTGTVGATTPLASLTTDAGGTTTLSGGSVATVGVQNLQDALLLTADTVLTGTTLNLQGGLGGGDNDLVINGHLNLQSDVTGVEDLDASGTSSLNGNLTTSGRQDFRDTVTLQGDSVISGQGIRFFNTIDGNALLTADGGSAEVRFDDALGGDTALSGLDVSGSSVRFLKTVEVDDQGLIVNSTLTTTFEGSLTSTSGGTVTLNHDGQLTLANGIDFQLDGAFEQAGSGNVTIGADILTTADTVSFASNVTQTAAIAIATASGISTGAHITFQDIESAGNDILLNAGTSGNIETDTITNAGEVNIVQAASTTFRGELSATTVTITDTETDVVFQADVVSGAFLTAAEDYSLQFLENSAFTNAVVFQNTGGVQLGDATTDVQTFSGGITSNASVNTLQGTIVTSGNTLRLGDTTLVDTTSLRTGPGGGAITLGQISGSGVGLTADAGTGNIDLSNAANVIGNLSIASHQANIAEADDITQSTAWAVVSDISLTASGHDILMTDVANEFGDVTFTADNIQLSETGNTTVSSITATGDVQLNSTGAINDATTDTVTDVVANTVTLTASTGIGSPEELELQTQRITAVTAIGDIDLQNTTAVDAVVQMLATSVGDVTFSQTGVGNLSIQSVSNSLGSLGVTSVSSLSVSGTIAAASGDISLTTGTGDVALDGVVSAVGRSISISSGGTIEGDASNILEDIIADELSLAAANGIGIVSPLETTVSELALTTTGTGNVSLVNSTSLEVRASTLSDDLHVCTSSGDITITGAIHAAGQSVTFQTDSGGIYQSSSGSIIADDLGVKAANGIDLSQNANNVVSLAATSATGDVRFVDADGFAVSTVAATGCFDGATGVTVFDTAAIDLETTGPITVNSVVQSQDGSISIESLRGAVIISAAVSSDSADIEVLGDQIQQSASISIASTGNILVSADSGNVAMVSTASLLTNSGSIELRATGDIAVASVTSSSGDLSITADSNDTMNGSITDANGGGTNLATSGETRVAAGTGISIDTNVTEIIAEVSGTGDISIAEADSIFLTNVSTADGSIVVTSAGELTATSVQSESNVGGSISLTATTGNLTATNVLASGDVILKSDDGQVELNQTVSTTDNVTVTAQSGDIRLNSVTANATGAVISLTASGDIIDTNGSNRNLSATSGTVTMSARNIGLSGTDVFKPTAAEPVDIDASTVNVTATGTDPDGNIAVHLLMDSTISTLSGNVVFISGDGDLDLSPATPVANSLSVITASGVITLPSSVAVTSDLRLEGQEITNVPGPLIDLTANRILFVSASSAQLSITATEFDGKTDGDLFVSSDSAILQLTDLNCDSTTINTQGATAILEQTAGGTIYQQLPVDASQNSRVLSDSLLLTGSGTFELTNVFNSVSSVAADVSGAIAYTDADTVAVGNVNSVAGVSTTNQDLLLQAGDSIHIVEMIDVGTADVRIVAGMNGTIGSVSQDASGSLIAGRLGVRNEASTGSLVLAALNDVDLFAASNQAASGTIIFQDSDEVAIGRLSSSSVPDAVFAETTGLRTNDGGITIAAASPSSGTDSLLIDDAISAGNETVRLVAAGDIRQSAAGTIEAEALGIRQIAVEGSVVLDEGNHVNALAASNAAASGTIGFRNLQSLIIGTVVASSASAAPDLSALQFEETNGLLTNNGIIQLNVDGALPADGAIQLEAEIVAGTAGAAITADGQIQQTSSGRILATDLVIRQRAETSGQNVDLGAASNDVTNLAISNSSEDGDIFFNDISDLTITRVGVASVGSLSVPDVSGLQADGADINVTAGFDFNVNDTIDASSDLSVAPIDETITLISRSGDFVLADGVVISTDENPAPGEFEDSTGDKINILAGTDGSGGVVDLGDPTSIEIRTDGGLARQIAPRPSGFTTSPATGVETAFVTLTDAASSRSSLTFQSDGFLGELEYIFGVAGEENLEVVVDWGVVTLVDLAANGVAGDAVLQPSGTFAFEESDRDKSIFYIDEGGQRYQISHVYETGDLITTPNDRNGRQFNPNIIGVRFSVAQHESISIWGSAAVDPTSATTVSAAPFSGTASPVTDASGMAVVPTSAGLSLLSSTDTSALRDLRAEASSDFPLQNQALTSSGTPEGLAEWEFIAGPSPGIILFQPTEQFVADFPEVVAPIDAVVNSDISGDAFFGDGAASDAGVGTDVYLQIRRYFELDADAEIVMARINDSDLITSRQAFEEFVAANPELQDGAGYEVWLVTETGGQRVERPVVEFEITGGRPGPPTESMLDTDQPTRLQDLEFRQADETDAQDEPAQKLPEAIAPAAEAEGDNDNSQSHWIPEPVIPDGRHFMTTRLPNMGPSIVLSVPTAVEADVDDAGALESFVSTGAAVTSFSAVARFRAKQKNSTISHSRTSRTMRLLRRQPVAQHPSGGEESS